MSEKRKLKVVIASDVDYENLIAEIYCDDKFIALLQQESGEGNIKVELSSNIGSIDYDWLQNALSEARKKLMNK